MIYVLGTLVAIAAVVVLVYNRMVSLRQETKNAFADIETQLKMRADLIPNLVETVRGYASHEKGILEKVTEMRSSVLRGGKSMNEKVEAEQNLSAALVQLLAVAENYPQLKADASFRQLQSELSDIENKVAAARRFFNNAVAEYNSSIEQFPAVFFSKTLGFDPAKPYELTAEEKASTANPPKVQF